MDKTHNRPIPKPTWIWGRTKCQGLVCWTTGHFWTLGGQVHILHPSITNTNCELQNSWVNGSKKRSKMRSDRSEFKSHQAFPTHTNYSPSPGSVSRQLPEDSGPLCGPQTLAASESPTSSLRLSLLVPQRVPDSEGLGWGKNLHFS